jgi:hypothetical protein
MSLSTRESERDLGLDNEEEEYTLTINFSDDCGNKQITIPIAKLSFSKFLCGVVENTPNENNTITISSSFVTHKEFIFIKEYIDVCHTLNNGKDVCVPKRSDDTQNKGERCMWFSMDKEDLPPFEARLVEMTSVFFIKNGYDREVISKIISASCYLFMDGFTDLMCCFFAHVIRNGMGNVYKEDGELEYVFIETKVKKLFERFERFERI